MRDSTLLSFDLTTSREPNFAGVLQKGGTGG